MTGIYLNLISDSLQALLFMGHPIVNTYPTKSFVKFCINFNLAVKVKLTERKCIIKMNIERIYKSYHPVTPCLIQPRKSIPRLFWGPLLKPPPHQTYPVPL